MIIKSVNLETVCGITSRLPENAYPEFAFAGKSNVGKSSLINVLINRKSYARTSAQPGKTQTINYYRITAAPRISAQETSGNEELYFVDLPGYGYAKVSQEIKAKWGKMIEKYLHTSRQLKCIFLLVDIRHDPSANDVTMYQWIIHNGFQPVIVATKADKINRSQLQKHLKAIRMGLNLSAQDILIPFSSQTKQGKEEIYEILKQYLPEQRHPSAGN